MRGIKNLWEGEDSVHEEGKRQFATFSSLFSSCVGIIRLWQGISGRKKEERFSKPFTGAL